MTPASSTPLVSLRDVSVHFALRGGFLGSVLGTEQRVRAVDGVSLDIAPGETFGLALGPGLYHITGSSMVKRLPRGSLSNRRADGATARAIATGSACIPPSGK